MEALNTGYLHPQLAEASLPVSIPDAQSNEKHCYQILSACGTVIRQGSFIGCFIHISTRLLPKGERFVLRILANNNLLHEGSFATF